MGADADEAVRRLADENIVAPVAALLQGIARVLCSDPEGGNTSLEDAASLAEEVGAHESLAITLCERSLLAMTRSEWGRAEGLADQARTVLRRAGIEDSYTTSLVCAVALPGPLNDPPAARPASPRPDRRSASSTILSGWANCPSIPDRPR